MKNTYWENQNVSRELLNEQKEWIIPHFDIIYNHGC